MNILILTSWYPNKIDFVSGVFVKEQVKALQKVGVSPVVFFPFDKAIEKNKLVCNKEDGVVVYRANTDYMKNSKLSRINSILKGNKFLKKIVRKNNIELIHSHVCYSAGFMAAFFNRFNKTPYVITEHMSKVKEYSEKAYNRKLFKFAYENSERVISVSRFLNDELHSLGYDFKGDVIGNVVDVNSYNPIDKNIQHEEINILFIGLMVPSEVKGLQFFIPALADFVNKNSKHKIKFTLVGDGAKRKKYEEMCKKLGVEHICHFVGKVSKEEVPKYIEKCDFLVLPSVKETFGSVLIEAMCMGKPVLATKCGGPNEFVREDVGILVESKSSEALYVGLEKMVNRLHNFNSENIRKYVVDNYSYRAIGNKLKDLYCKILSKDI